MDDIWTWIAGDEVDLADQHATVPFFSYLFIYYCRSVFIFTHSHPSGFHWGHQCSWTLTSANSMQVSNIEFLTVTGSNQTQGKVSLSDCEKAEHSVLGQVGKRSRIHWTMEVLTHKMKQKWNNFQSFISDIFSRITSIVLLSIVHQNNHNLFQLKNHPSTTLYNNISILLSKKKST